MSNRKTLEVDISAPGVLPEKFRDAASKVLKDWQRVEVASESGRVTLRAVWDPDAEAALVRLREALGAELVASSPRVIYLTEPELMEPVMMLRVTVPEFCMGDVLGDINRRRGVFQVIETTARRQKFIESKVPLPEMIGYVRDLRRLSGGEGTAEAEFDSYQPAPLWPDPDPNEPWSMALRA